VDVAVMDFELRSPAEVRAAIATAVFEQNGCIPDVLGAITLHQRQRIAAERLIVLIREHGGALLADPVGTGKTFTALVVAAQFGGQPTIVAPASLRTMWLEAIDACAVPGVVVSHESLSRGAVPSVADGLIIVDEAHRFRSALSKRYATLAAHLQGRSILLVSATPIQNRRADLSAQLALFLGRRAWAMEDAALATFVVRDETSSALERQSIPTLNGPLPIAVASDDDCLDQILALPSPLVARDESIAATLLAYGLVHQWSSSRSALLAALRRRRTKGVALLAALDSGRYPTRAELTAWTHFDDAVQLAFPELVSDNIPDGDNHSDLTVAIDRHLAALEALIARCGRSPDPDDERAALLARLLDIHRGERIIAFCHYAETVEMLRRRLASRGGIATLTAKGARIASGRVPRSVILAQFIPREGRGAVDPSQRVDLLIATDLLSEGLNLQEASVVVHLDLPWNPARLDQRVGRVRRFGSRHRAVTVYSFAPPTSAERMLSIEARLREKLRIAGRTVGVAGRILPAIFSADDAAASSPGVAEQSSAVDRALREWMGMATNSSRSTKPVMAGVMSDVHGFIAVVRDGAGCRLIADVGNAIVDDAATLELATSLATARGRLINRELASTTLERVVSYLHAQRGAVAIDFVAAASARTRRSTLARVAQALARVPRHRRSVIAPLADAARAVASAQLGEGAERVLETLARAELPDEAWLRSIAAFAELNARPARQASSTNAKIIAVLVFVRAQRP
jgi:superfamily II DNA or RNA helicase